MKKRNFKLIFISIFTLFLGITSLPFLSFKKNQVEARIIPPEAIEINTIEKLQNIGNLSYVDPDYPENQYSLDANYVLTSDLDFRTVDEIEGEIFEEWTPIGIKYEGGSVVYAPFTGKFYGNGYKISNMRLANKIFSYYECGLFGSLSGAEIYDLALVDYAVFLTNILADIINNKNTLYIGGIAGRVLDSGTELSIIQNCFVSYKKPTTSPATVYNSVSGNLSLNFGGIVGDFQNGSIISDSYSDVSMILNMQGGQGTGITFGGICGSLISSSIFTSHSKATIISSSSGGISASAKTNGGGIAGYVSGANSKIITTYFSGKLEATSENSLISIGGIIGTITQSMGITPVNGNLNYAHFYATTNDDVLLTQAIGEAYYYSIIDLVLNSLTQDNYALFDRNTEDYFSFWSEDYDKIWNFDSIWSFHADSLPTLQVFKVYTVNLNENTTLIGENSIKISSLRFALEETIEPPILSKNFRYNSLVEIVITILSDNPLTEDIIEPDYNNFYELDSVNIDSHSVIDNPLYTIINNETEEGENKGVWTFSYYINDQTLGNVSISLRKIPFDITVKTDNPEMGKVQKQYSSVVNEFTESVKDSVGYHFIASPINNNIAFSHWVFEFPPEEEGGEFQIVPLESELKNLAQFAFTFGLSGNEEITQGILNGGKLVAVFTSNICKIEFTMRLTGGGSTNEAGTISYTIGGENVPLGEQIAFVKGKSITLVVSPEEGFIFEGWFDEENRFLSSQTTYIFTPESDTMSVVARFSGGATESNLLWLWIVLSVLGAGGIGVAIFFIIRSKKDSAYKNFY